MDYNRLKASHAAFKEPSFAQTNFLFIEYSAMKESGMTDSEWYGITRRQRAARVAHMLARNAIQSADAHDRAERAKQEAKNK